MHRSQQKPESAFFRSSLVWRVYLPRDVIMTSYVFVKEKTWIWISPIFIYCSIIKWLVWRSAWKVTINEFFKKVKKFEEFFVYKARNRSSQSPHFVHLYTTWCLLDCFNLTEGSDIHGRILHWGLSVVDLAVWQNHNTHSLEEEKKKKKIGKG